MLSFQIVGLVFDMIGVILLGIDLILVQRTLKLQATQRRDELDAFLEEFGGIESWASEIGKQSRWVQQAEYSDYHAEDEVSYNASRSAENTKELARSVESVSQWMTGLVKLHLKESQIGETAAKSSLRFTAIGLFLIVTGFSMQIFSLIQ